ncbi:hypothetical protein SDC9_152791 [bioreactor metagenome]|uniref:NAD-specific glutamate dehydrogenase n=1 Tax=bioreactor metagenome TaxID=1076179 RepID=A0A645EVS4_9ZZZZ
MCEMLGAREHGGGLLALQHRLSDFGGIGERRDAGLDDLQAGDRDARGDLLGEFTGDQIGGAAQALLARLGEVVGMRSRDVTQCGFGLHLHEILVGLDSEDRLGSVGDLPDDDGRDIDRIAVGVIDLQLIGLEVADLDRDSLLARQRNGQ